MADTTFTNGVTLTDADWFNDVNDFAYSGTPPSEFTLLDISGAAQGQIKFPAPQNASSNANTLDDYEEGVWTPALTFATAGDLSVAYTSRSGAYTKIGRQVFLVCNILTSTFTHATASGELTVTGLPFLSGQAGFGALAFQGITVANYTNFVARIGSGAQIVTIRASGTAQNQVDMAAAQVPTGGTVRVDFTLSYIV